MVEAANYIVLAIPVFFLLIGVEIIIDKLQHTGYYRLNDAISNLNAGITEQVTGAFAKLFVTGIYVLLYMNARFFTIPDNPLTWILLFMGIDFFYYWFHRFAHEINILWGGHVVHHQSEEYNLSVALRQGAFQKFGSFIFYLPLALFGFNPVMFIVISQIQTLYQFWIHTKLIGKMHPALEYVLNTPSHHRVHHGRNPKYIDRNHGGTLIIWDRMFGTFQKEEEEVVYGITQPLNSWNPLKAQLSVWADLLRDVNKAKGFQHKMQLLFHPPGWYPAELGGPKSPPEITEVNAQKFDIQLPQWMNYYVFIHFVIVLAIASYFLFSFDTFDLLLRIAVACIVIYSITVIGGLLELRSWSLWLEFVRLLLLIASAFTISEFSLTTGGEYVFILTSFFIAIVSGIVVFNHRKIFTH